MLLTIEIDEVEVMIAGRCVKKADDGTKAFPWSTTESKPTRATTAKDTIFMNVATETVSRSVDGCRSFTLCIHLASNLLRRHHKTDFN